MTTQVRYRRVALVEPWLIRGKSFRRASVGFLARSRPPNSAPHPDLDPHVAGSRVRYHLAGGSKPVSLDTLGAVKLALGYQHGHRNREYRNVGCSYLVRQLPRKK